MQSFSSKTDSATTNADHQAILAVTNIVDKAARNRALKSLHGSWLQEMHNQNNSALQHTQQLSNRMDILILELAQKLLSENNDISIIALGGFGRQELYPLSDIDLLILSPSKKDILTAVEKLLYPLWDIGLKVGHSLQSPKSCLSLAKSDHTFNTALLDARLISGDVQIYRKLCNAHQRLFTNKRFLKDFIAAKYAEQLHRHQRHGDHRSMIEPNIKEGVATHRDLQQINWIEQAIINGQIDHAESVFLCPTTKAIRTIAYNFYANIRLQLHLNHAAEDNRLLIQRQSDIALELKFRHHRSLRPIERLMKLVFYFRAKILLLQDMQYYRLGLADLTDQKAQKKMVAVEQYSQPQDIIEIFAKAASGQLNLQDGYLDKLYHCQKHFITFQSKKVAKIGLRQIICNPAPQTKLRDALSQMSRLGIIGRIVPEYRHIHGLTQLDGYHTWTVSHHTLNVIANLHALKSNIPNNFDPAPVQEAIDDILIFSAFLHDIAKGLGGGHADKGAMIALNIAPQFGFNPQETESISWLVKQHLLLSDLALHRDILDAGTIAVLLNATPNLMHLDKLYCLTIADIQGVSPTSWTTWKATVIGRLYRSGKAALQPSVKQIDRSERIATIIASLKNALPDMPAKVFDQHIRLCSGEYLLSATMPLLIEHAKMLTAIKGLQPYESHIRILPDPEDAIVRLILYTQDYSGRIAHTVGVLTEAGYSIVTLKTFPYGDHGTVMTVWFHHQGKVLSEERRLNRLHDRLSNAIAERFIDFQNQPHTDKINNHIASKVTFDNDSSNQSTVIEIRAHNRAGLLFDLALALNENQLRIHAAKVDTVGQRAMDVFYVRSQYGYKVYNAKRQSAIQKSIMMRITEPLD